MTAYAVKKRNLFALSYPMTYQRHRQTANTADMSRLGAVRKFSRLTESER